MLTMIMQSQVYKTYIEFDTEWIENKKSSYRKNQFFKRIGKRYGLL